MLALHESSIIVILSFPARPSRKRAEPFARELTNRPWMMMIRSQRTRLHPAGGTEAGGEGEGDQAEAGGGHSHGTFPR